MSKTNWEQRNYSGNVSAVLAPNNYVPDFPDDAILQKTGLRRITVYSRRTKGKNHCDTTHCGSCYCRDPPEVPNLRLKPEVVEESCPLHPRRRKRNKKWCYCCKLLPDDDVTSRHSQELLDEAHKKINYQPESHFLKQLQKESHRSCEECIGGSCAPFTDRREEYENMQPFCELDYASGRESKSKGSKSSEQDGSEATKAEEEARTPTTENEDHCQCCKCFQKQSSSSSTKSLDKIKQFRDDNYFETHSSSEWSSTEQKQIEDHVCVHKFYIDKNLMQKPVNSDPYGASRCVICKKPMRNLDLSLLHSMRKSKKPKTKRGESKLDLNKVNLEPRKVYMGSGNERIEIDVPLDLLKQTSECRSEFRGDFKYRPNPANTMALRYQKGMV